MKNQKVSTGLGAIVLVIFTITVLALVWKYEKNHEIIEQSQNLQSIKKPELKQAVGVNQNNQVINIGQELPVVYAQPGESLENIITEAIFKKYPDWKNKNYSIVVVVEKDKQDYAVGKFSYITNLGKKEDGVWFAAKSNNNWTLTNVSYTGYWGSCQDFKKYKFPADMIPDCWDTEKNVLIETSNPKMFYKNGFTKNDKKDLIQAFKDYAKVGSETSDASYWKEWLTKDLYLKINKNVTNYFRGVILVGGLQNMSAPEFLATKQSGKWIVVYRGQDIPVCSVIEPYKFPHEIVETCYDEVNKKEKSVL